MGFLSIFVFAPLLGCSEPVYYPSITRPLTASDSGAGGGDTAATGLDLSGVPCSASALGPAWLYAVNNQHADTVLMWQYDSACQLTALGVLAPGPQQAFGDEGEVFVFTDDPASTVLAWLQVLPNDAASVVIP